MVTDRILVLTAFTSRLRVTLRLLVLCGTTWYVARDLSTATHCCVESSNRIANNDLLQMEPVGGKDDQIKWGAETNLKCPTMVSTSVLCVCQYK